MNAFIYSLLIWFSSIVPDSSLQSSAITSYSAYVNDNIVVGAKDNTCLECHNNIMEYKQKHSPADESCEKCHTSNGQAHPKEGVKGFTFTKEMPLLCFSCHEMKVKKTLHQPSKDGQCLDCHSPHSSNNKSLLIQKKVSGLCNRCHDLGIKEEDVVHNPVSGGRCNKCHDPHQSDFNSFLSQEMPGLCFKCHETVDEEMKLKTIHTPAKENCSKCHNPHSAKESYLLPDSIPNLCFTCHTDINIKKNIHKPAKDGKCKSCHAMHGSNYKKLVVQKKVVDLCKDCHQLDIKEDDVVHNPVSGGRCHKCHDPHQSDFNSFLSENMPELCYKCHDGVQEEMEKKTIHSPAKENCFNCHNPHNSKESYLLLKPSADLCYSCHEDSKKKIEKASIVHKALNEEQFCANCHSPHGSNEANYLKSGEKELCLSCHNKEYTNDSVSIADINKLIENSKSVHKPVNEGCSSCHNAHVSEYPGLLIKKFPVGLYAESNKKDYALCFSCHKSELMELEKGSTATNFRNGDQNLHFLHIKGKRGRNCTTCHNVHASKNEFLIENNVLFGNWNMPIKFVKRENGGSCAPGCHSEETYDRGE